MERRCARDSPTAARAAPAAEPQGQEQGQKGEKGEEGKGESATGALAYSGSTATPFTARTATSASSSAPPTPPPPPPAFPPRRAGRATTGPRPHRATESGRDPDPTTQSGGSPPGGRPTPDRHDLRYHDHFRSTQTQPFGCEARRGRVVWSEDSGRVDLSCALAPAEPRFRSRGAYGRTRLGRNRHGVVQS